MRGEVPGVVRPQGQHDPAAAGVTRPGRRRTRSRLSSSSHSAKASSAWSTSTTEVGCESLPG